MSTYNGYGSGNNKLRSLVYFKLLLKLALKYVIAQSNANARALVLQLNGELMVHIAIA